MARILVIDDERNVRRMICMTLGRDGHQVVEAADGPTGLSQYDCRDDWDVAIVDERMPGMTGRTVIREIMRRRADARAIMVTAFATSELAAEAVMAGAVDFLRKPFSTEMLRRAVAAALRPRPSDAAVNSDSAHEPAALPHFLNGFYYRGIPMPDASGPEKSEIARAFEVVAPLGSPRVCVAAIMPHILEAVRGDHAQSSPALEPLWQAICESTLAAYLWEHAETPPPLLPVFELTAEHHDIIGRILGAAPALSH